MIFRIRECELVVRTVNPDAPECRVRDSETVYRITAELRDRAHESMVVIMLDARQTVCGKHEAARGNVDACPVTAATVFRAALVANASAIILVHNHPSGSPEPSSDDLMLTSSLVLAGKVLGVGVLDHVIVTSTGYFSMLDAGMMERVAPRGE